MIDRIWHWLQIFEISKVILTTLQTKSIYYAGIGLEIALQFLRGGEKVVLSSRYINELPKDNPEIKKFVENGHAHLQQADLSTVRYMTAYEDRLSTHNHQHATSYGLLISDVLQPSHECASLHMVSEILGITSALLR